METLIEITVEVGGHRKEREKEIKRACMVEWAFRDDDFYYVSVDGTKRTLLQASALGALYGGDDKQDIVERIERAVWRANCGMCHVEVSARHMNSRGLFESAMADDGELVAV